MPMLRSDLSDFSDAYIAVNYCYINYCYRTRKCKKKQNSCI